MLMSDADNAKNTMRSDTIPRIHNNDPTTDSRMMQSMVIRTISVFATIVGYAISCVFSSAQEPSPPAKEQPPEISPDKKWEYIGENAPKLVKADTKEAVLEFSCGLGGTSAPVWAPDSKRFAITCGGGKGNETSVYQLRDDQWVAPEEALGNGDQLMEQAGKLVEAQAKKKGLPKNTFLHMQWWTVEPKQWLDASTLVVYASMAERVHRQNGEDVGLGFGTDLLATLKLDDAGNWKIVNTHRMSKKEVEERANKQ
jgi:hypothetical protein